MTEIKIKLQSQDGQTFEVEESVACMSLVIKIMIEGFGTDQEIPLPNVKATILEKVIEYSRHYKDSTPPEIESPLRSAVMEEVVPAWDAAFVDLEHEIIFELILAARYLEINSLYSLCCAKIASMLKNKSAEEIRETFNIENTLTPEEEAQVREENRWAEMEW